MPRQLRIEYPGAIYDVMNRMEAIVRDDGDRKRCEGALEELVGSYRRRLLRRWMMTGTLAAARNQRRKGERKVISGKL